MIVKNPLTLKFLSACKFKSKLFFKEDELKDDDKQKINNYFKDFIIINKRIIL